MKFKRDWRIIYRDVYGGAILSVVVIIPAYLATVQTQNLLAFIVLFLLHFTFICMFCGGYYFTGTFTNIIIFDDGGITFQQRKQLPLQIHWDEIDRIIRTRYIGGKAIVFWDKYGQEIWFYNSRKIEGYILSQHPELEPMFPKENDYRKWQEWDKKLRF